MPVTSLLSLVYSLVVLAVSGRRQLMLAHDHARVRTGC